MIALAIDTALAACSAAILDTERGEASAAERIEHMPKP
jgi:tRNA A37 threonylcarbamoyladenosine modification protein TsaB